MLNKIALVAPKNKISAYELELIQTALSKHEIISTYFADSDDIDAFHPDCVLVLSPEVPKLTKFPTYGLIDRPVQDYLALPRYTRNLLTYDGYLTLSQKNKEMLEDLLFGARKLSSTIACFDFTAEPAIDFNLHERIKLKPLHLSYFEKNISRSPFKKALKSLIKSIPQMNLLSNNWGLYSKLKIAKTRLEMQKAVQDAGIGLCLDAGNDENKWLDRQVLDLIASGAITIAPYTEILEAYFGDNLYYFSPQASPKQLSRIIKQHLNAIQQDPEKAAQKAAEALRIYTEKFAFHQLISQLKKLHEDTLAAKGFIPHPSEDSSKLPSVSYIIRTGGKSRKFLENSLTSLVNQQYPHIHVILVVFQEFDYIDELIASFPSLKFKIIHDYHSIRSKAICDGMKAVETDLFGLLDDDDELHPNHVRSLVKTLAYHHNRDWRGPIGLAYSGSIIINKRGAYETEDEFLDAQLAHTQQSRCIEHFRFYRALKMANHQWYMMSNAWLARRSLLDDELLLDPGINTCEDLYFELQLAQRTHFAFSVETTVFHHFHTQNSTIVDANKHLPDTRRIALRTAFRTFCGEFEYDNAHSLLGMPNLAKKPLYGETQINKTSDLIYLQAPYLPICAPQYFSSYKLNCKQDSQAPATTYLSDDFSLLKPLQTILKFLNTNSLKRKHYLHKAVVYYKKFGLLKFVHRLFTFNKDKLTANK